MIRKALNDDIDVIEQIYDSIHDREEKNIVTIGWIRGVYPTRKTAENALIRNDLFVIEEKEKIIGSAIINKIQVPEYKLVKWKHIANDDEVMVLHTLTIDPIYSGRGYGKKFVKFYEQYALERKCYELRIDTNALNSRARKMYAELNYEEIDIIKCDFNGIPSIQLVCLEKYLNPNLEGKDYV